MSRYGNSLSARYEDEQHASAVLSGGPSSQLCDFPDSDDAPPRPVSRRIGFTVTHSEEPDTPAPDPLTYEGDQA